MLQQFVMHHPYTAWYLFSTECRPDELHCGAEYRGAIYLSKQNEIGIAILQEHARKGYATQAIKALMEKHPRPYYFANVAPMNQPSHELFQGMGFELVQLTYRLEKP